MRDLQKIAAARAFTVINPENKRFSQLRTPVRITNINQDNIDRIAVWDTGATGTVISRELAKQLVLPVFGRKNIATASGDSLENIHYINLLLPNNMSISGLLVVTGVLKGFDFLIGMNIITYGDFSITNVDGRTVFSYRYPSIETIDYLKATNTARIVAEKQTQKKR